MTRRRAPKAHPWLTLTQAATAVGMPPPFGRLRLQRRLLAIEADVGRPIMRRGQGKGHGARYAVTLPLLRHWCPDLFAEYLDLPGAIRDAFTEVHARIDSVDQARRANGSVIRELSLRVKALESGTASARE